MTPQALKSAILQLAIQGKLVPQRPEDGSADALLRQIQDEKLHPAKAGTIKKEKPLPEIGEDEIPFEIPASWRWVRLGSIGHTNIGLTYSPKDTSVNGTVVLRSNNIQNGKMDYTDLVRVSLDVPKNKMCQRGDILICARNGSKKLVGKSAIIDQDDMCFGAFMAIFRSQCNEYVFHAINAPYFHNSLLGDAGTTTINQITQDMLKNALIPLPPLPEQHRIVAKIEELLPLIDRYEQAWTKLEDFTRRFPADMQKALLQMAIQGHLVDQRPEEGTGEQLYKKILAAKNSPRPKSVVRSPSSKPKPLPPIAEDEIPFEIPETWGWAHLEIVSNSVPSKPYQILESEVRETGTFPVISQSKEYSIGFTDNASKVYHHANPVIVFGDHTAEVKYVEFDFVVGADGTKIFEPVAGLVTAKFLYFVLQFYANNLNKVGGYSRHYKFLKNNPIPLPPLAEQKRIVAKLEELLPLCKRLK